MKKRAPNKYLIAIIVVIIFIGLLICFGSGGYGIPIAKEFAKAFSIEIVAAIFGIIVLSMFIFKLYSNDNAWEKLYSETRKELIKTTCELADATEELEELKIKLSKIKEMHPEIDFSFEIGDKIEE